MEIKLKLIATDDDHNIAKSIVENHHSYVPTFKSVGRRIDWLIAVDDDVVGLKAKFVKPTGENKKVIFFKELKNNYYF